MESSFNVVQMGSRLGAYLNDEVYCWGLVSFLVDGYVFNVPGNPFSMGSEYFATKYLQSNGSGPVALEGVTPSQFRTFLKLVFPIHSTSTKIALSKPEWLVILTLSTLWHFLDLRKLAIEHLDPQMGDPIELIVVGRAECVPRWVMTGYEALVFKPGPITEEESDGIGDRTAVRLYIIRHTLRDPEGLLGMGANINGLIRERFREEMDALERGDNERKSPATILQEKVEAEEAKQLRVEAALLKMLLEEGENARRMKEEEERLRRLKEEEDKKKEIAKLKAKEEEEKERARLEERNARLREEEKKERSRLEEERKVAEEKSARLEKEKQAAEEEERKAKLAEVWKEFLDEKQKENQKLQGELAERTRMRDAKKKMEEEAARPVSMAVWVVESLLKGRQS
ncbi:hypothetical protein D9611_003716 [Ephemerocybe angulata]|uniref:Uncharacterized protein n=1 Tax=Ephemerocybe angulata TaxID=980116 RepID=A0A8H5EYW7_9AGAR|nr:hypothetical protein D9611_003716 [Tulosesus angulatus]